MTEEKWGSMWQRRDEEVDFVRDVFADEAIRRTQRLIPESYQRMRHEKTNVVHREGCFDRTSRRRMQWRLTLG